LSKGAHAEPRLDRPITLHLMGDWGIANLHRICGWISAELWRRSRIWCGFDLCHSAGVERMTRSGNLKTWNRLYNELQDFNMETGDLGQWSVPQIVRALRDGQAPDRALSPFAMLWPFFHNFTDEDATAIATFLKTKSRPVQNLIPPKLAYGLIETIAMKLTRPLASD
jgi:hypothetical protein